MTGFIALETGEYSVNEVDGTISVTIVRTGDLSGAVNIDYGVNADTADADVDFIDNDGQVTIAAGESEVTVTIQIVNDQAFEDTEVFSFSLINVDSGNLQFPRTARVNILDDENPVDDVITPPLESEFIVTTETILDGIDRPIALEFLPGSTTLSLMATKPGEIQFIDTASGEIVSTFVNLRDEVNHAADRGLLDIAIHPEFPAEPYIYAFYVVDPAETAGETGNAGADGAGNRFAHVVRFEAELDENGVPTLIEGSKTVIVGGDGVDLSDISGNGTVNSTTIDNVGQPDSEIDPETGEYRQDYIKVDSLSHAGGALEFGPDGMLYVGIGDGTSFDIADPRSVSVQDIDSLAGKILRIDPITGQGLVDNPFYEDGMDLDSNASKVYQLGLRNPYTMAIDDQGRVFISNTGWFAYEEIESGAAGANFGWPFYEGGDNGELVRTPDYQYLPEAQAFYDAVEAGEIIITPAFRAFSHANGDPGYQVQAIVGASDVFTGDAYDGLFNNYYFFTDVSQGEVFAVNVNDRREVIYLYTSEQGFGPVHFQQGNDGLLYYVDIVTGEIGRYDIEVDPNGGGGGGTTYPPTSVDDIPEETQTLEGTLGDDTFVIAGNFADYEMAQTEDRNGVVIWNDVTYDVLTGFEFIEFADRTIDATKLTQTGPDYQDDDQNNLNLVGVTENDRFIIDGLSTDYSWEPLIEGIGTVVYDENGFDVLNGFEQIVFADRTVVLAGEPTSSGDAGGGGGTVIEGLVDDIPEDVQELTGTSDLDVFVIDGNSADYGWGPTESSDGYVIWTNDEQDDTYDILRGFETIRFNDQDVDISESGGGGGSDGVVLDIENQVQHLVGTSENDIFVIDADADQFQWGPSESGNNVVVYGATGYDVLTDFETLQFNDQSVDISDILQDGPNFEDIADQIQFLTGTSENDTFVIDGLAADYSWGPNQSATGIVVWTTSSDDETYDVLRGFETLQFNDASVAIDTIV